MILNWEIMRIRRLQILFLYFPAKYFVQSSRSHILQKQQSDECFGLQSFFANFVFNYLPGLYVKHFRLVRVRLLTGIIFLSCIGLYSCEERFEPVIATSDESHIVVDGMISNLPGPYTVKLSLSSTIDTPKYVPLSDFMVRIMDDNGQDKLLTEIFAGTYTTVDTSFRGQPGTRYKLSITSPSGQTYESPFEKMPVPTGIASVDHELEYISDEDLIYDIAGYRFSVSSAQAPADTNYFMWQLISTHKYRADFNIYWVFDGSLRWVNDYDTLKTCYKTDTLTEFFLLNTENIRPPVVQNYPLHFVSTQTRELMERYSLLVRQFSMSGESFTFWKIVREQNTNLGELFTKQPFQVRGNVFRTENPDEVVLGNFMVAGISEKRVFVDKPKPPVKMRYPACEFYEGIYENFSSILDYPPSSWPVFATRGPDGNALPNQWCMDCRRSGGTLEKPDFWID